MSEWGIALIAAGSAVAGSVVTGFFAWKAGHRQAEGAEAAGQAQAHALLHTVNITLREQRLVTAVQERRSAYARFLDAALVFEANRDTQTYLECFKILNLITMLGAVNAAVCGSEYVEAIRSGSPGQPHPDAERLQHAFLDAATEDIQSIWESNSWLPGN
ncbi:hypothetical protein ACFW6S_23515 [Streptomyces sp. NPDC058740]|uniref:hypothetical protein n=1 Tax=Streptomyces sp. NPDC058740 TaxID=3346619 RepID=UPI0036840546